MREVARPVRIDPERVERVDFVLREDRVDGVRPEPVRVEPVRPDGEAGGGATAVLDVAVVVVPGAARPQVSQ